jgi:Protein of unknown function (DUF3761)./Bacterial SH3 domain.
MKRLILSIFLNLAVISLVCSQEVIKVTTSNLNLRLTPDSTSEILTVLPKGTTVKIKQDCDCTWIPVLYDGNVGYVKAKFLKTPSKESSIGYAKSTQVKHYKNSKGDKVQSPTYYNAAPAGATALCRDGTYSFSRSRRGTCSHHGGVAEWL